MGRKDPDEELTSVAASLLLRKSRERVIRLIQSGALAGRRDPQRGWLVSRASAEAFAEKQTA